MKRREILKSISLGSLGLAATPSGELAASYIDGTLTIAPEKPFVVPNGRLKEEAIRDAKLKTEKFFTAHELKTVTILSDIIIPADAKSGSATQAGVPAFIEFMMKDQPQHQDKMRGGLMWLDFESTKRFGKKFVLCSKTQQLEIVEDIAYPAKVKPAFKHGASFFSHIRNFVVTGFYTSPIGFKDLGYMGNTPNQWEGVPEDVVAKFGLQEFNKITV
ncbi:gluconate 2-dehydrogenase subunit 3 family protein [Emticicia sp.]|uniref:gluconate 2-dehydrogenase subunit 3 family protein n=1 Tax=Emticicia sp. TaxID=1930953 RepID=UPI003752D585